MSKPKFIVFSREEMDKFISTSSSFEEVLTKMRYGNPSDKRIIAGVRKYCDTLNIKHDHLPDVIDHRIIRCKICNQEKDSSHYYFTNGKLGQKVCKECVRARQNEKYHLRQEFINDYKSTHPCVKCGCSKFYLIDFHHLDPNEKDYNISDNSNAKIETILQEVEKCITLCSNCHREFHYLERENGITIDQYLEQYPMLAKGTVC